MEKDGRTAEEEASSRDIMSSSNEKQPQYGRASDNKSKGLYYKPSSHDFAFEEPRMPPTPTRIPWKNNQKEASWAEEQAQIEKEKARDRERDLVAAQRKKYLAFLLDLEQQQNKMREDQLLSLHQVGDDVSNDGQVEGLSESHFSQPDLCPLLTLPDVLLERVLFFLSVPDLLVLSEVNRRLWRLSGQDKLWRQLAISEWPELAEASEVDDWKYLFERKSRVRATQYKDLMTEFEDCDWYTCANGHPYLIGECRIPVLMGTCPTCGAKIGGKHHMMLDTNRRLGHVGSIWLEDNSVRLDRLDVKQLKAQKDVHVTTFSDNHDQQRDNQNF